MKNTFVLRLAGLLCVAEFLAVGADAPEKNTPATNAVAEKPYSIKESNDGKKLVVNGKEYGPYEYLPPQNPVCLTPDRRHWISFVKKGGGKEFFVVDGREYPSPVKAGGSFNYGLSENGEKWAACVESIVASPKDRSVYALIQGKPYGPYAWVSGRQKNWLPVLSANGKTAGFVGWKKDKSFVVVINDTEYGPYKKVSDLWINAEGNLWVIWVRKAEGQYVVLNGKEYGPYLWTSPVFLSPDQTSWAFYAGKQQASSQEMVTVMNGTESPGISAAAKDLSSYVTPFDF